MPTGGRGGGQLQTGEGHSSGARGGNRAGEHRPQKDADAPRNPRQSQGKDPHRGQAG
jgi:hypothetical protein